MESTSSGENLGEEYYIEENSIDGFKNLDFEKEHFVDTNSMEGLEDLEFAENEKDQPMKSSLYKGPPEPCIGLIFEEWEDAQSCYKAYARRKGFSIRKNRARRSRTDNSVIGVEFCCHREGFRRPSCYKKHKDASHSSETMIGCKATMHVTKDDEKWVVSKFETEHNHVLCSPKSTLLLRGNRGITRAQKNLIDVLNDAGVPPRKIVHILALFVKKNRVHHLPQHYILQRWTINAKSHVANEISSTLMSEVLEQEGIKSSSTFTKHSLMIEVLKVVEEGQKSQKKHAHLALALHKVHSELLAMGEEEEDNEDINIDGDLGSAPLLEGGTQLLSNITFTLHDPPHVASKGRPKSLRQKHPMENQVGKKRKCGICRQPGHIRTNCPTQKEARDNVGGTSSSPTILNASTNQALHKASLDFNSPIIVSQDPRHSTFMDLMMEATYTSSF
ncbi:hypothetical protein RHGRI_023439 [Rhododendron griersonianum]|uniref:FAR1 domain-containing protein n=1 Tax=Rhododendron griersonianum TaxID=479676 RepID=A0AAV6J7J0_9ERIC|nr:hypothetical protein RHGRI_023439 [Rhododendron griersonianum]